jgi:uncharacterized membrane protein YedE/YeeE
MFVTVCSYRIVLQSNTITIVIKDVGKGDILTTATLILAAFLAGVIGFAAQRASLCSVRAVEEILTTRRAYMLTSFVKTVFWVIGASLVVAWILPASMARMVGWNLSLTTLLGGAMFGVGATFNGGCAFSTLTRLGTGNLGMVVALIGFLLGAGMFGIGAVNGIVDPSLKTTAMLSNDGAWRLPALLVLSIWMAWELIRLSRSIGPGSWRQHIVASRYRLSVAAALMGISNALLYALIGVWPFTKLFGQTARHAATGAPLPPSVLWLLFAAIICGISIAARQGGRFRWLWRPQWRWLEYGMAGVVMGVGAAMIPGGNDVLILHGIPSLSPHAIPAFLAMLGGIALSLLGMRSFGRQIPQTDCGGDICHVEPND